MGHVLLLMLNSDSEVFVVLIVLFYISEVCHNIFLKD